MADLGQWRSEFPVTREATYLVAAAMGAAPRAGVERMRQYGEDWARGGMPEWMDIDLRVGPKVARILGAKDASVTFYANSTDAAAVAVSCFDFDGRRNKVVYPDQEFPSIPYMCMRHERLGARVRVVPSRDGIGVDTQELVDAIDEETLLVVLSHVFFRTGYQVDMSAVMEKAHRVGTYVLLDVYQSAGAVPVKAEEWGVHFIVGGCLKWLCGGPGAGFLYVRPDLASKLLPRHTGWLAHARPMDFDLERFEPAEGPTRFRTGAWNVPAIYAGEPGLDIILEIGIEAIRENSLRQTDYLIEGAKRRGWRVWTPSDPERRGAAVSMEVPDAERVVEELGARNILVNLRPPCGIRVAPHFYNTIEDLDTFFTAVDELTPMRA